jgi:IS1 family transposase
MNCRYCNGICIKKGIRNTKQRYQCKSCKKSQLSEYSYRLLTKADEQWIEDFNSESVSMRGMARLLKSSVTTIQRKVFLLSQKVIKPIYGEFGQEYEVDELCTYIGKNENGNRSWLIYGINKKTNDVIDIAVGKRTLDKIRPVIEKIKSLHPKKIFTDKLNLYPGIIHKEIHSTARYKTNQIERSNLTIRNSLKRLSRKTLCYSKSEKMLEAVILLYFKKIYWSFCTTDSEKRLQ